MPLLKAYMNGDTMISMALSMCNAQRYDFFSERYNFFSER